MIEMNAELFQQHTQEGNKPVLVEFWAPWCVYCRRIGHAFERIGKNYDGIVATARVNIDEEPGLARRERIEVVPTLVLYQKGQVLGSIVAPESRYRIEEFLEENLG